MKERGYFSILISNELILRTLNLSDAQVIFDTIDSQREYLGQWLPWVKNTKQISDTENFIKSIYSVPLEKQELVFAILYQEKFIGIIGYKDTDEINMKTEIGYWLSEKYQKKGIMTHCVKILTDYAFEELSLNRVQIKCATGNMSSKRIAQKLNFTFEGIERGGELSLSGEFFDLEVYSILKKDLLLG